MSKSLTRVKNFLDNAGLDVTIIHMADDTKTAAMAASAVECDINQIAKSIIFLGATSQRAILFLTAGGNRVNPVAAADMAEEPLIKADAALIRAQTGFAIGGVAPVGHISPVRAFVDPKLFEFDLIWAAAGTPHHMFQIQPQALMKLTDARLASENVMVSAEIRR